MSTYRLERQFGVVLTTIFIAVALWPMTSGASPTWFWMAIAITFAFVTGVAPRLLCPLVNTWMKIGHALGIINTNVLLAIVFFIFITPIALLFHLTKRDVLKLRWKKADSYWSDQDKTWTSDSFKNQF